MSEEDPNSNPPLRPVVRMGLGNACAEYIVECSKRPSYPERYIKEKEKKSFQEVYRNVHFRRNSF